MRDIIIWKESFNTGERSKKSSAEPRSKVSPPESISADSAEEATPDRIHFREREMKKETKKPTPPRRGTGTVLSFRSKSGISRAPVREETASTARHKAKDIIAVRIARHLLNTIIPIKRKKHL